MAVTSHNTPAVRKVAGTMRPRGVRDSDSSGGDYGFTPQGLAITHRQSAVHSPETKASIMKTITKDQFVALLNEASITDAQKHKLHALFEIRHPQAHEAFLQWLGLPPDAIRNIRENSRKPA